MKILQNAYGRFDLTKPDLIETLLIIEMNDGQIFEFKIPGLDKTFEFSLLESCTPQYFMIIMRDLFGNISEEFEKYLMDEYKKDVPERLKKIQSKIESIEEDCNKRVSAYKKDKLIISSYKENI